MKKIKTYLIVFGLIGLIVGFKFVFLSPEKAKKSSKNKDQKKPASPVSVFVVGHLDNKNALYAGGTLLANEATELKTETSGKVVYLHISEGTSVTKGTLLLKTDDSELKAQWSKVRAQLLLARQTLQRVGDLLKIDGASKQEFETETSHLQTLKADSAAIKAQLDKTEIRAPFTGILGIKNISEGSYVGVGTVVVSIFQLNPIKIEFSIPEKYASQFKVGDKIQFKAEGKEASQGIIQVKDPLIDVNTRSVRFRAIAPNPQLKWLQGTYVQVNLDLKESSQGRYIPTEAIIPTSKGNKIFKVENGLSRKLIVETGLRTEDYIQVLKGLQQGDSIVITGQAQLKDSTKVKVTRTPKQVSTISQSVTHRNIQQK